MSGCVRVCACTCVSDVQNRAGAVHVDSHLLNARDDFFLMSRQVHTDSSQIPENSKQTTGAKSTNRLRTDEQTGSFKGEVPDYSPSARPRRRKIPFNRDI